MALYRKRPVEVEAEKWDGDEKNTAVAEMLKRAAGRQGGAITGRPKVNRNTRALLVTTVDGNCVWVPVGTYVVIDGKGYPYPCDAGLFEANHDPVREAGTPEEQVRSGLDYIQHAYGTGE